MKIKSLKTLVGSYGSLTKGEVRDIQKSTAVELIALGYATDASDPSDPVEDDTSKEEVAVEPVVAEVPVIATERPKKKGKSNADNEDA